MYTQFVEGRTVEKNSPMNIKIFNPEFILYKIIKIALLTN